MSIALYVLSFILGVFIGRELVYCRIKNKKDNTSRTDIYSEVKEVLEKDSDKFKIHSPSEIIRRQQFDKEIKDNL